MVCGFLSLSYWKCPVFSLTVLLGILEIGPEEKIEILSPWYHPKVGPHWSLYSVFPIIHASCVLRFLSELPAQGNLTPFLCALCHVCSVYWTTLVSFPTPFLRYSLFTILELTYYDRLEASEPRDLLVSDSQSQGTLGDQVISLALGLILASTIKASEGPLS